jgi:hypothetical protein
MCAHKDVLAEMAELVEVCDERAECTDAFESTRLYQPVCYMPLVGKITTKWSRRLLYPLTPLWGHRLARDRLKLPNERANALAMDRSTFPLFALQQLLPREVAMIIIVLSFWGY